MSSQLLLVQTAEEVKTLVYFNVITIVCAFNKSNKRRLLLSPSKQYKANVTYYIIHQTKVGETEKDNKHIDRERLAFATKLRNLRLETNIAKEFL